jgi:carboxyl-terminal processing protease
VSSRLLLALTLAAGFAGGFAVARWTDQAPTEALRGKAVVSHPTAHHADGPVALQGHELLDEVVTRIRREYVDPLPERAFDEAAVKGIVSNLDPHSAFLDAAEYQDMRAATSGSYSGVGIEVSAHDGRVVVVTPIEGSPAARAGVRPGDIVLAVDGRPVEAGKLDDTIARMRGATGTTVRLAVDRQGEPEPLLFSLERSEVHMHTVKAEPLPGDYGYVRISQFADSTPDDLVVALQGLVQRKDGGVDRASSIHPLRGMVLDLRGNPGGVLESAVGVADTFLDAGVIVRADGRTPESRFEMSATPGDLLDGQPLVVLVNRGSASGSEIVAGALRDHGRATLMGERTFGKGSVQTVIPLRDGQALKLTTSRYYTPAGASIQERGLEPDIQIGKLDGERETSSGLAAAASPMRDPAVLTALQYLRDRGLGTHYAAARRPDSAPKQR